MTTATCEHRIDPPIRFRGVQIGQASCLKCGRGLSHVLGDATCSILRPGAEQLRFTAWVPYRVVWMVG